MSSIIIKGAKEHNLKNISLQLPKGKLIVISGPSGSGKTSLALDVIHRESRRIFTESTSLKSRGEKISIERADVDFIEGLSPTIAIEGRSNISSRRSTIATATEILYFLRILYEKSSIPHCPKCGLEIVVFSLDKIVDHICRSKLGAKCILSAPIKSNTDQAILLENYFKQGFIRYQIDEENMLYEDISEVILKQAQKIEVIVDRFTLKKDIRTRVAESVGTTIHLSRGLLHLLVGEEKFYYNTVYRCSHCETDYSKPNLRLFTFNHPDGACKNCEGTGENRYFSKDMMLDISKSISEGGILYFSSHKGKVIAKWIDVLCEIGGFDIHTPLHQLTDKQIDILMHGSKIMDGEDQKKRQGKKVFSKYYGVEGIAEHAKRRLEQTDSEEMLDKLFSFTVTETCKSCQGARLGEYSLACTFRGKNINDLLTKTIDELKNHLLKLTELNSIEKSIILEIDKRLTSLNKVGLGYLSLNRPMNSLSGGEENRIKIANQINSNLTGVTYIFDEPSKGLHPTDIKNLVKAIRELVNKDNTVILIEHKPNIISYAEHLVILGPSAGEDGGKVMYQGVFNKKISAQYQLKEKNKIHNNRQTSPNKGLEVEGIHHHNLKNQNLFIPLNRLSLLCGVSGSGKSSLIEVIYPHLLNQLMGGKRTVIPVKKIKGLDLFDQVYLVDQSPIGASRRSTPGTYLKIFDLIRKLYAELGESKVRGYNENHFSFNGGGGRCEICKGLGDIKVNMHLLPDMFVTCDSCQGKRYLKEILEITYQEKNIADVLEMSFEKALKHFIHFPLIAKKIKMACDIGLQYLKLGQPSNTLSGGEHQRLKLALEMGKFSSGRTFYLFDEPTTGLSISDIDLLMHSFNNLLEQGNTLLVIEHHLHLLHHADHLIELGPEGGAKGGETIYRGDLADFTKKDTPTSSAYRDYLREFGKTGGGEGDFL